MRTTGPSDTHNRHKKAFSNQSREVIRISDVILEILDARFIKETRIPELEKEIQEQGKTLIHVVTKIDLVGKEIDNGEMKNLANPICVSVKTRQGVSKLREIIHILSKKNNEHAHFHVGIIGYPNTGKSSLISLLARRAAAPKSPSAGFTKGIRKVRLAKGIILLDAPGIVRKDENLFRIDERKFGLLGIKNPENVKNPDLVVAEIMKMHPGRLEKYYQIEENGDVESLLSEMGKRWNMVKKRGIADEDKTARRILKEWNEGKIKNSVPRL